MIKTDIVGPLKNIKGGCAAICHRLHHLLRLEFCKRLMGDSVDTVVGYAANAGVVLSCFISCLFFSLPLLPFYLPPRHRIHIDGHVNRVGRLKKTGDTNSCLQEVSIQSKT